jgi:uridine kinase
MADLAPPSIKTIVKRNGTLVAYRRDRIANAIYQATAAISQPDQDLSDRMAAAVEAELLAAYGPEGQPTVEDIQDVVEATLMTHRLTRLAKSYIIYRHDRALARAARSLPGEISDNIPYKHIYEVLLWNSDQGCLTAQDLNETLAQDRLSPLIAAAEARYQEQLETVSRQIITRRAQVRLVIVAGPSSSAKTTTTLRLRERLAHAGMNLLSIELDHYFFNLIDHPRDDFGDYDYERPQALNLDLINRHIADLLAGREIKTPHYDFKTGISTPEVHPLRLPADGVLLIDSLHGLYAPMTDLTPNSHKFKVYVETLAQFRGADGNFMRWADLRLLRRMVRDKAFRNLQPLDTLTHWHYVRRSELQDIIPHIHLADAILNTALPYELPILKQRLFPYFPEALERFRNVPRRQDAFRRAQRIYDLLAPLASAEGPSTIPKNSVIREFIGGD